MSAILKQKLIDIANGFTKYGLWKGGGSSNLSELDDVNLTNLKTNDVLTYNGSFWVNDDNLQTQINTLNSNLKWKLLKVVKTGDKGDIDFSLYQEICIVSEIGKDLFLTIYVPTATLSSSANFSYCNSRYFNTSNYQMLQVTLRRNYYDIGLINNGSWLTGKNVSIFVK